MVERARLRRVRWRIRGAWMWPAYVALSVLDGVILHLLPAATDAAGLGPSLLLAAVLNIALVALLAPVLGLLLGRARPELPPGVARDYAGTVVLAVLAAGVLAAGLAHQGVVSRHEAALAGARRAARAYIAAHAPSQFAANAAVGDTLTVTAGALYRTCVPGRATAPGEWCVLVSTDRGPPRVRYSSREPNYSFAPVRDLGGG